MASTAEVRQEQEYFDRAAEARERRRETLKGAPAAAAGPRAAAAAVKRGADAQLAKVADSNEPVAFGRFLDTDNDCYYLGRHAISDQDRNILVINWQAPAATPYFAATFDDPCGVISRRKFSTKANLVEDFDEVIFADLADAVDQLTQADVNGIDDAVLRDLNQVRDGEMRDIVQTIHAAQYELIRSDLDQLLVVQGGPGTGKTAVALHRVSWLLWNHADRLSPADVLVIGPNATFTRYIRKVLPGLGEDDVRHVDVRSLGPLTSSGREEPVDVLRLKGEQRLARLLGTALRQRVRMPSGADQLEVGPSGQITRLSRHDVETAIRRLQKTDSTYNSGRQGFRAWVVQQVRSGTPPASIEATVERIWPNFSPQQFLQDLFASRERLVAAAGDDFTAGDVQRLLRGPSARISEETWSDADVALLDELQFLLTGSPESFGHVVLDEAQDLSPMQLRSIRRRSRNGSMTIVGDIAQSTGPAARDSWDALIADLRQNLPTSVQTLTLGYRVPKQIYAFAAEILPHAAPGVKAPVVVRTAPEDPEILPCDEDDVVMTALAAAQSYAGRGLFVGVIVPDSLRSDLLARLGSAGITWGDAAQGQLSTSINVLSAEQSKGLEFDAVVIAEPSLIANESQSGLRLLYVALTRATRFLTIAHAGPILPTRVDSSPGESGSLAPVERDALVEEPASREQIHRPLVGVARDRQGELFGIAPVLDVSEPVGIDQATAPSLPAPVTISKVARAVARSLAEEIRESLTPQKFAEVLAALQEELSEPPSD